MSERTQARLLAREHAGDLLLADYVKANKPTRQSGELTPWWVVEALMYGAVKAYRVGAGDRSLEVPLRRKPTNGEQS